VSWTDRSDTSLASLDALASSPRSPLSLELVMGDRFPEMVATLARNLRERRATVAEIVVAKP
jgi:hypothetical protein